MAGIEEIEQAVNSLPSEEYFKFRQWFFEKDWADWDCQLEADSSSGKLDFLYREALEAKKTGKLKKL
jgi:hypothetical protein